MAKKRKTATRTQTKIIRMNAPRAAAPIVVRTSSAPIKRRRSGGRRHKVGGGGALNGKTIAGVVIGGALLGWIEKNYGAKLPVIPVLRPTVPSADAASKRFCSKVNFSVSSSTYVPVNSAAP